MPPTYHDVYARWRRAPETFWAEAAEAVHWYRRWDAVLDTSRAPFYRWFTGGQVNSCYNALDRHVENGRADQVALADDFVERFRAQALGKRRPGLGLAEQIGHNRATCRRARQRPSEA